jgi:hypothetical protein
MLDERQRNSETVRQMQQDVDALRSQVVVPPSMASQVVSTEAESQVQMQIDRLREELSSLQRTAVNKDLQLERARDANEQLAQKVVQLHGELSLTCNRIRQSIERKRASPQHAGSASPDAQAPGEGPTADTWNEWADGLELEMNYRDQLHLMVASIATEGLAALLQAHSLIEEVETKFAQAKIPLTECVSSMIEDLRSARENILGKLEGGKNSLHKQIATTFRAAIKGEVKLLGDEEQLEAFDELLGSMTKKSFAAWQASSVRRARISQGNAGSPRKAPRQA